MPRADDSKISGNVAKWLHYAVGETIVSQCQLYRHEKKEKYVTKWLRVALKGALTN